MALIEPTDDSIQRFIFNFSILAVLKLSEEHFRNYVNEERFIENYIAIKKLLYWES